jgi:signal recognition particle subunit SRP54
MVLGTFTLEDMLAQLRMIRRLGPLKKVLGMMPGMGQLADLDLADDSRMTRMEALFTSMTPRERLHPELIDMSRRRRIARGAGQEPQAVGDLLKGHKAMKQAMKELNRMGLGAKLGSKAKQETLRGMSPTGELAAPGGAGGGLFGGLGLGDLFGGGRGAPGGAAGGPGGMFAGPRPMGSSATRKSGSKRKQKQKRKKGRRGR